MDLQNIAERWARTWESAWPAKDVEAIAALYADDATYRSHPMDGPVTGSARAYTLAQFAREKSVECRFGSPIQSGERAAVEWWASWLEDGREVSLAGVTVLRFDVDGRVMEHIDYWVHRDGRIQPFEGWGS